MQKCFFLICPTDCIEPAINKAFKYENYFYTSLGNSFVYDHKTTEYIRQLIKKHSIRKIYFVLSIDNKIILDALYKHQFLTNGRLNHFYKEISKQKENSKRLSYRSNYQFTVFSYYLNKKIKELELQLTHLSNNPIKIGAKIYNRDNDAFTNIYSNLICLEKHHLN